MMDALILENFRCFAGRIEAPIRPLTLLVGENSTGKTSFLAAMRATHELRSGTAPDFNGEPFRLGSYDQIANYRGGRAGRATSFIVGQRFTVDRRRRRRPRRGVLKKGASLGSTEIRIEARLASANEQPAISELQISSGKHKLVVRVPVGDQSVASFSSDDRVIFERTIDHQQGSLTRLSEDLGFILRTLSFEDQEEDSVRWIDNDTEQFHVLIDSTLYSPYMDPQPYAFAPVRTNPRRTYDPTKETPDPEGGHIPMMLARLLGDSAASGFKDGIEQFGRTSGLYSSLSVHKLGQQGSDPFQIQVKHSRGPRRNLIDVGYGVSQAIPIIADCLSAEHGSTLLIQQPEVHLHPRAQAAMGSFFGQLAESRRNQVVVETHSDYLVDRVCMSVRDEEIKASDVMILYFEQGQRGVKIHPIEVDAAGRVVTVPDGYRSFFLEEQRRFFGVD